MKTRNAIDKNYLYEIHRAGCAHLKFNKMNVWETEKYVTPEEMIEADIKDIEQIGGENARDNYRIMPCVN